MANKDFKIAGYEVPVGTLLLGNIYRVHTDEESWKDPEEFRPERWLQGGRVIIKQEFIPFGTGKKILYLMANLRSQYVERILFIHPVLSGVEGTL